MISGYFGPARSFRIARPVCYFGASSLHNSRFYSAAIDSRPAGHVKGEGPYEQLTQLYQSTLDLLNKFPGDSFYRTTLTAQVQLYMNQIDQNVTLFSVGDLICRAERELALTNKMLYEWKPWCASDAPTVPEGIWKSLK